ncbi:tripartite motif-containing protein 65 isoform X2 [Hyalella azteca]|uniref:Tripartite motif-containing protein 65 isoform X2 n=1 Tax=Hyalella azteca TaxID=294128 RepID=A0A979FIZ0_HYAAZ|nr:tripartite motif-containing protein 65 isoform X2 [Hyalella azteca]
MANNSPVCEVCIGDFDSEDHKPLMLPCGHAFCYECVDTLAENQNNSCPSCRRNFSGDIGDLPVCYTLIPKTSMKTEAISNEAKCHEHEFQFLYWCKTCKQVACKQCALGMHNGHNLLLKEEAVKLDSQFFPSRDFLINKLTTQKSLVASLTSACDANLSDLTELIARIENQRDYLNSKKIQIEQDLDILQKKTSTRSPKTVEEKNWTHLMITSRTCKPIDEQEHLIVVKNVVQRNVLNILRNIDVTGLKSLQVEQQLMMNDKEWNIANEEDSHRALLTLWTTSNKPSNVVVRDAPREPISSMPALLACVAQVCDKIDLQLRGSFWQTYYEQPQLNDDLLRPFIRSKERISQDMVLKLASRKMFCLGLRIDHATDMSIVNAVVDSQCHSFHIAVSEQVGRQGLDAISPQLLAKCCVFLHFVQLNDGDVPWLMHVVDSLVPRSLSKSQDKSRRIAGLYLVDCQFTALEALRVISWVDDNRLTSNVWYQTADCDDFTKKLLQDKAAGAKIELSWNAILPRAPRILR